MSTKKTGVVHTITAEQKEKMDKQADIQSRMEAGKGEIMKGVEGVQGAEKLAENFNAIMGAIIKAKPSASKGQYVRSCTVAATMGPGIKINGAKLV